MLIPAGKPVITLSLLTALLFCALFRPHTTAASAQLSESQARAVFVFNIIRYVTWPKEVYNSENTLDVGILSKSTGDTSWNILKGKTVQGRQLVIRKSSDIDDLRSCQIIYIDTTARKDLVRILNAVKLEPIMTISDIDNFHTHEGGMITLNVVNNKLNFKVNLATARKSSLDISSHLLKLAHEVLQ